MKELIANPGKYEELIAMKTYDQSWKVLVMGVLIFLYACAAKTPNGKVNCFSVVGSLDYTIQADGGEIHVELSNDADHIFVLSPKSWCKAKMTNEKGEGYVQIMVEPNTEATNRAAKIMLSSNHDCPNTELTVQQIGAKTGGDPNTGKLKVSSYNIRYAAKADIETGNGWEVRKQHVANLITTHNFDIVGTQEGNDAQLADLKAHLPAYNFVGHPYGGANNKTHNCAIFYKKERYTMLDQGVFWLSETPDLPSIGWDADDQRICYWAKFKELETSLEFYFFTTHFYWRYQTARLNSGPVLVAKMKEIAGDAPTISTGDYNSLPSSSQIRAILVKLQDAYHVTETLPVGPVGTNLGGGVFWGEPTGRIDYIFVSNHFKVKNYAVLTDSYNNGRYPSDHLPVSAELSINLE